MIATLDDVVTKLQALHNAGAATLSGVTFKGTKPTAQGIAVTVN